MPIPTERDRIGTTVGGKYELKSVLGRGGMGVVYEAVHTWTQRRVAVKLLHPHFLTSDLFVSRFLREAQSEAAINHPNIVDVLDMGTDGPHTLFLALEYLQGESLAERLDREAFLAPSEAVEILLPAMAALDAAHAGGVIHRDIKPDNIFLSIDGAGNRITKVLDFGIAKLLGEAPSSNNTRQGELVGTPEYMSPEQAAGRQDLGPASDVWSMGVVLYECVTSRMPFEGDTPHAACAAILQNRQTPLHELAPALPPAFTAAVERALDPDPTVRYTTMRQFGVALAEACELPHPWAQRARSSPSFLPVATRARAETLPAQAFPQRFRRLMVGLVVASLGVLALLASRWTSPSDDVAASHPARAVAQTVPPAPNHAVEPAAETGVEVVLPRVATPNASPQPEPARTIRDTAPARASRSPASDLPSVPREW